ncbi:MAG: response regulator transcription factor [Spirochaetales bacterium]|nr:response regulator transcription factor [Spirochaetales bacterium]
MGRQILVVEDNGRLRKFIASNLEKEGYSVIEAESGKAAFNILKDLIPDLILLDLKLGDYDGIDILKTIRRQDDVPVIIVSSIDTQEIKIGGFDIGCDDYITKPFYIDELIARVNRLIERVETTAASDSTISEKIFSGPFEIDISKHQIRKNGEELVMREKLFNMFLYFAKNPDIIITYERLFNKIWSLTTTYNENSLYVHVRHLRALIEEDPSHPRYIKTVKNTGYIYSVEK